MTATAAADPPLPLQRQADLSGLQTWAVVPGLLLSAAACALWIDVPVAHYCRHGRYPAVIADFLNNAEPFGHAAGVTLIVLSIAALDPARRRWAPWLCAGGALAGGLAANLAKLLIRRTRPRNYDFASASVWDTFGGWLPFASGGTSVQSFPSAHTSTAVAFAVALSAVYPRGRWWFFTLAVLVGLHRIQSSAHYLSDVLCGAALGWVVGRLLLRCAGREAVPQVAD